MKIKKKAAKNSLLNTQKMMNWNVNNRERERERYLDEYN